MDRIFRIDARSTTTKARAGEVTLAHGVVQTPIFMPIGTQGTVKSLTKSEIETAGSQIILGNTYHLWLRPDTEVLQKAGGLHMFSGWDKPILTDSGGFQAFSLAKIRKFDESGVMFCSHLNGEKRFLSPEESMRIQTAIGSDIALVLDECLEAEVSKNKAKSAMLRTRRWAERSYTEFYKLKKELGHMNHLFGIPQGAQFNDLRVESAKLTMELDFPGYSIGGVANGGEPEEVMYEQVLTQTEILEDYKPRHLLGVGKPHDIVQMIARGIDMFDCVLPTRNARHGSIYFEVSDTEYREVKIKNKEFEFDYNPINEYSKFPELRQYSKAYLRHLFKAKELLGFRLATMQNIEFYMNLTSKCRDKILCGEFDDWYGQYRQIT
jgi:queuine tRNA-ribosyltransferase